MTTLPDYEGFARAYGAGEAEVAVATLVADLETPVSAYLKLARGRTGNMLLLESVEGGAQRGRYSMIGLDPDLVFRSTGDHAEINRRALTDPETFVPCPGRITDYHPPGGLGVRVDSGLYTGYIMPPYYDSMVAKLIVNGTTRNECLMRLRRSLEEFVIGGIDTTIPLHQRIIGEQAFIDGDYDIHWLEKLVGLKK